MSQHPGWFIRDWKGDFQPTPWRDRLDIIDLHYGRREVREYTTTAMVYRVRGFGIDVAFPRSLAHGAFNDFEGAAQTFDESTVLTLEP